MVTPSTARNLGFSHHPSFFGDTNINNMLLLCRHHARVHEGHWQIRLDPHTGQVHVTRPDGTPYELQPSQPWLTPTTQRGDPPPRGWSDERQPNDRGP